MTWFKAFWVIASLGWTYIMSLRTVNTIRYESGLAIIICTRNSITSTVTDRLKIDIQTSLILALWTCKVLMGILSRCRWFGTKLSSVKNLADLTNRNPQMITRCRTTDIQWDCGCSTEIKQKLQFSWNSRILASSSKNVHFNVRLIISTVGTFGWVNYIWKKGGI